MIFKLAYESRNITVPIDLLEILSNRTLPYALQLHAQQEIMIRMLQEDVTMPRLTINGHVTVKNVA